MLALAAGVCLAADLTFWHHSIEAVGAGLATVLANVQVVLVGLMAWAWLGERPERRSLMAIPVVFVGVVLISGAVGAGAYGEDPLLGVIYGMLTALSYALFLLILRQGNSDIRRPAGPLFDATLSAGVFSAIGGHGGGRPRLGAGPRGTGLARAARPVLAGARLDADLGLAAAAAGGPDLDPAHAPACGDGVPRRGAAVGGALGGAARRAWRS